MDIDKRLVLQFEHGQMTFRRFDPQATYEQLFNLANAINAFQEDTAQRVLLVTDKYYDTI